MLHCMYSQVAILWYLGTAFVPRTLTFLVDKLGNFPQLISYEVLTVYQISYGCFQDFQFWDIYLLGSTLSCLKTAYKVVY